MLPGIAWRPLCSALPEESPQGATLLPAPGLQRSPYQEARMKKMLGIRKLTLRRETIRNLESLQEVVGGIGTYACPYGGNETKQNSCDTVTFHCGASLGVSC